MGLTTSRASRSAFHAGTKAKRSMKSPGQPVLGEQAVQPAVDDVGGLAEDEALKAVPLGLQRRLADLDLDGVDGHALALHQLWGQRLKVLPVDVDDLVFEAAFLGIARRAGAFVGHLHARHHAAEGVGRGALGHEARQEAESMPPERASAALPSLQASLRGALAVRFPASRCRARAGAFQRRQGKAPRRQPVGKGVSGSCDGAVGEKRTHAVFAVYGHACPSVSPRTAASALETCVEETPRV